MLTDFARTLMGIDQSRPVDCVMHPGGRADAGFVTFFFYDDGRPLCLAKVARCDESSLRREAENLDAVARVLERSSLTSTIDRTLGTTYVGGRLVLFKSFSAGRPAAQVFSGKNRRATTLAFRNCCHWILQFIHDTREFRGVSDDQKREALSQIDTSGRSAPWIEVFVESNAQFTGPAHGDLVPANILLENGEVRTVVDFENFEMAGLPIADFIGLIMSTATKIFGRRDAVEAAFGQSTWFSSEVGLQVARYCSMVGCGLDEFIALLPLYSDRAVAISEQWGMEQEMAFHEAARQFFIDEAVRITATLSRPTIPD